MIYLCLEDEGGWQKIMMDLIGIGAGQQQSSVSWARSHFARGLTEVEKVKWGMLQVLWIEVAQQWICIRQNGRWCLRRSTSARQSVQVNWLFGTGGSTQAPLANADSLLCNFNPQHYKCRSCVEPFRPCGEDTWPELDCQLLHSCLLPARAASWYSLESPHLGLCSLWPEMGWEPSLKAKWACCA